MREILFRGKRIDNGEWVYGDLEQYKFIPQYLDISELEPFCCISEDATQLAFGGNFSVIKESVGQYTGLTDKNGTKIFEGDIVKLDSGNENYVVYYDEKHARYDISTEDSDIEFGGIAWWKFIGGAVEVIGNIYDNPKLLDVQDDE